MRPKSGREHKEARLETRGKSGDWGFYLLWGSALSCSHWSRQLFDLGHWWWWRWWWNMIIIWNKNSQCWPLMRICRSSHRIDSLTRWRFIYLLYPRSFVWVYTGSPQSWGVRGYTPCPLTFSWKVYPSILSWFPPGMFQTLIDPENKRFCSNIAF